MWVLMYAAPVVPVWAHRCSFLRSAMLVGTGLRPLRTITPWLALKYGVEKSTFFARADVMVTSANVKSHFFGPGAYTVEKFELLYQWMFEAENPSFLAMTTARSISKPFGLLTLVPRTEPLWKPTAGRLSPTVSTPGVLVGGAAAPPALTATTANAATPAAMTGRRFTWETS